MNTEEEDAKVLKKEQASKSQNDEIAEEQSISTETAPDNVSSSTEPLLPQIAITNLSNSLDSQPDVIDATELDDTLPESLLPYTELTNNKKRTLLISTQEQVHQTLKSSYPITQDTPKRHKNLLSIAEQTQDIMEEMTRSCHQAIGKHISNNNKSGNGHLCFSIFISSF